MFMSSFEEDNLSWLKNKCETILFPFPHIYESSTHLYVSGKMYLYHLIDLIYDYLILKMYDTYLCITYIELNNIASIAQRTI